MFNLVLNNDSITLEHLKNFDLSQTLDCGQCFRWKKSGDNSYKGIVNKKVITATQVDDNLILNVNKEEFHKFWIKYFDLETDYEKICNDFKKINPILKSACEKFSGIRILRQDPWETICSFIISQNNNIPRIKKIIERLCVLFGDKISEDEYSFPRAETISKLSVDDLSSIKSGFRAKYILDAAQKIESNSVDLEYIKSCDFLEAKNILMTINGVGPKVADCVLLYGFHRLEAFPMDVWMKKISDKFLPNELIEFLGKNRGIAQQYLYHYARMNPEILEES